MTDEAEKIEALKELPLKWEVRWIHLKDLFPGKVIEEEKNEDLDHKFGAVDMKDPRLADEIVRVHNEAIGVAP